jgi:hypothetical protein
MSEPAETPPSDASHRRGRTAAIAAVSIALASIIAVRFVGTTTSAT